MYFFAQHSDISEKILIGHRWKYVGREAYLGKNICYDTQNVIMFLSVFQVALILDSTTYTCL